MWPVAQCDLSDLLHAIDTIRDWKKRDNVMPWGRRRPPTSPTEEENRAHDLLIDLDPNHTIWPPLKPT